ncbi:MAG: pyridoxal-phosphate dependent enzyme [Gammaproteobacteria bacterium]|nr:pyridoxal-phosphate dependent enzyme [Gammaproteobacteria bacterium]
MTQSGLATSIQDQNLVDITTARLRQANVVLPGFSQLQCPSTIPSSLVRQLKEVPADEAHPLNLFRIHWHNDRQTGGFRNVPEYTILPSSLTGVAAPIVVLLGDTFPMISAHKVLPAYACLAPRLITGQFNPVSDRAVWPSTGNYCRGGVAISRILGCRGVAVLPEGMSRERFDWLEQWVVDSSDIIRTPGSESNVKEIYDKCKELGANERNMIINQFSEFGNYLAHYLVTGTAVEHVFEDLKISRPDLKLAAFISTTGSAGTIAAGDHLKQRYGSKIAAAEPVECPTMRQNGYGEHNIQGIGDKHLPYIQNVMNQDFVIGVSDKSSDALNVLFNTTSGREYLIGRKGLDPTYAKTTLCRLGLSSNANILAAIKLAKHQKLDADDVLITVATDGADMYETERQKTIAKDFDGHFDQIDAAEVFGHHLAGQGSDEIDELSLRDRERIFNLGYYTWVEQQGVALQDFDARKKQKFWHQLTELATLWDQMIHNINTVVAGT